MSPDSLLRSEADKLLDKAVAELRQSLESGRDCHAETVLNAFPYLASDPDRALALIVLEFQLRRQLGQNPKPHEWYERFPHWSERLRARLEEASPSNAEIAERETAAVRTSPYSHAELPTIVDWDVQATPILGRHEVLEEIGRGGMGVVYRARDLVLDRIVALKMIASGSLASTEEARRFYQEARAAAQLRHPNIVPIYGMGLYERQHCFTMPLFTRGTLAEHLADYRRDTQAAVGLLVKVARAVQAAHERGIIHRDLKPGNILLDEQGEPVVSDFGLAKRLEGSATQTLPAQLIGTPAYMAPEQARCAAATTASDVWSLGVIFYELLAGKRPFAGDSTEDVKQKILHAEPISPCRLRPDLPRDLETIVLTCLEKEPTRRFRSAVALADDLERWLRGEAIQARPEPRWQRLRRQFRRRVGIKGVLLLLVGLMMMGAGAAGVWTLFVYRSPVAREQRRQALVLASLQRELAQGNRVALVGEVGPPTWYRWRTEKGRGPLPEQKNWPLELDTLKGPLLLELLPDPHRVSYRFSAEVQPPLGNPVFSSEVGLYFACEELTTPAGKEECFGLFRLKIEEKRTKGELRLLGFFEQDADEFNERHEIWPSSRFPPGFLFTVPAPPAGELGGMPWRRIELRVTPVDVRAFCDGLPMGDYVIADEQKRLPEKWRIAHKSDDFPVAAFPLRGGMGLYVVNGPARFRNVVVEPLPGP